MTLESCIWNQYPRTHDTLVIQAIVWQDQYLKLAMTNNAEVGFDFHNLYTLPKEKRLQLAYNINHETI